MRELPTSSQTPQGIDTRDAVEDEDTDVTKHVVRPEQEDDTSSSEASFITAADAFVQPEPIDDKKFEAHEAKIAALQIQLVKLASEVNKAKGAVERVADLENDLTACKQEKAVMEEKIAKWEEDYNALKETSVLQGQELAALREDAVVFGVKQDTLADAHEEELAKLNQDHEDLKEDVRQQNAAHELLKQAQQIQETKLEAVGRWIKDFKASEFRAKLDQDTKREHMAAFGKRLSDLERDNTEKQTVARMENYGRVRDERGREHV
jgi:hypothetical protein